MNTKSINFRVVTFIISSLIILGFGIAYAVSDSAKSELLKTRMEQMSSITISKTQHIEDYFSEMKYILGSKALNSETVKLLWDYDEANEGLEDLEIDLDEAKNALLSYYENTYLSHVNYNLNNAPSKRALEEYLPKSDKGILLQYLYIAKNPEAYNNKEKYKMDKSYKSEYTDIHVQHHPIWREVLTEFGRNDLFIVNANGDVVYSVEKNAELGTNLLEGPYTSTGIARVFKKSQKATKGQAVFEDFSIYEPGYNKQVAFIAMPIYFGEDNEGSLIFQLPIEKINEIMNFNNQVDKVGLGSSGEAFLVGSDYTMRNESRFASKIKDMDESTQKAATTIGNFKIDTTATRAAISGESKTTIGTDYLNHRVILSYSPVKVYNEKWAMIVKIDEEEALTNANSNFIMALVGTAVFIAFMIIVSVFLIRIIIINKLKTLQDATYDLAKGDGDLTNRVNVPKGDEISEVAHNVNEFIEKVRVTVSEATTSSSNNTQVASTLSNASIEMKAKSQKESRIVQEVADQGDELQNVLSVAIEQAKETKSNIDQTGNTLKNVNEQIINLANEIADRSQDELELSQKLVDLSTETSAVKNVLEVIADIADQTNLLALNAAIEAARAGEHGRGFAVVADEVRKLAERTQKSLSEINTTISVITQSVNDASEHMSTNAKAIEALSQNANEVEVDISSSVSAIEESIGQVDETVTGYIENSKSVASMVTKVTEVEKISNENQDTIEEISDA
ncbi:MAG: methyl-accepting chemotaxis protein, partial [Campylobacterota bacterium]|nr:methyl-accepting chemotaxis protein [Campylobacterota bacterium]